MSHRVLRPRRALALLAVPALTLGGLVATSAPASAAPDPRPVTIGADWLAGQLEDGVFVNAQFDSSDYGLSIDAALAFDELGVQDDAVEAVLDRLARDLDAYVTGDAFGDADSLYAGAAAKSAVVVQATGSDPTAFGGRDLVADVEDRVADTGPASGRLSDRSTFGDFANTIGQGYAAQALAAAGSDEASAALTYLLGQQCDAGFFRGPLPDATAADQDCAGDTGVEADVDTTALTLLALRDLQTQPGVAQATTDALDWLVSVQARDGSFASAPPAAEAPNANSTGLAAWALDAYGRPGDADDAEDAAVWVRGRQADDPAACGSRLTAATGAIAYDDADLARGRSNGIEDDSEDRFRRASAQALPALAVAPEAAGAQVAQPGTAFRRAGTREGVGASGLAPGQAVCVSGPGTRVLKAAAAGGGVGVTVTLPRRTGTATYRVATGAAVVGSASYRVLAASTPGVDYKKRPLRGTNQRVVVSGLEAGESVTVVAGGRVRDRGTAGDAGRFVSRFGVGSKVGKTGLTVRGEFADRTASRSFVVVARR